MNLSHLLRQFHERTIFTKFHPQCICVMVEKAPPQEEVRIAGAASEVAVSQLLRQMRPFGGRIRLSVSRVKKGQSWLWSSGQLFLDSSPVTPFRQHLTCSPNEPVGLPLCFSGNPPNP